MFKHIKDNKGFSLIELMVVVAIIGILAAIAIPSYQGFQKRARTSEGKSLLGGVYTAMKAYEAENGSMGEATLANVGVEGELDHYKAVGFDSSQLLRKGSETAPTLPGSGSKCTAVTLKTGSSTSAASVTAITDGNWIAGAEPTGSNVAFSLAMSTKRALVQCN